jgi:GntR family transcriptional regulator/MocR family aminotransferase
LWSRITRQCLRGIKAPQLDYSARHGLAALREAIAEQVRWRGTHCDPSQIIVTAGAQRALNLLFQLLLDPGDCVWMEEPGYPGAHAALLASGAQVLPMPVDAHGLELPLPGSRAAMRSRAVRLAYVTPSHQFPLGVAMSLERRRDLLSWAVDSHAWIVEDDYDSEFRYQVKPLPCLHALDAHDRVIYVGSFSKTLFPALRIGFLIAPAHLADELAAARLACDVHPPLLEQAVLAEFMARGDYQRHLRRMRSVYRERLDVLQRSVASCGAPLRLRPVHTGLHAVADLDGVDAERVYREAVLRGIEVMPLSHYYSNSGSPPNGLVLGFGSVQPATLRAGVSQLAQAIEAAGRAAGAERQGAGVAARPPAGAGAPS